MAIFRKSNQSAAKSANTTVIATDTNITGEIQVESKVHVDGEFSGTINAKSIISVGKTDSSRAKLLPQNWSLPVVFLGPLIVRKSKYWQAEK